MNTESEFVAHEPCNNLSLIHISEPTRQKLEVSVAELLDTVGCQYVYEGEQVPYTIQHHYNPDFVLLNGVMLETKGYWDAEDRRKIKAVIRDNPHLDIFVWSFKHHSTRSVRNLKLHTPNGVRNTTSSGRQHTQSPLIG